MPTAGFFDHKRLFKRRRRFAISPLLCVLCLLSLLLLTGCNAASGEKQIFPICLSMDRLEDGRLQLAVQVSSMAGDSGSDYSVFIAAGDSFDQALEVMSASMPYPLHFGQLRLCIISNDLASQQPLRALLTPMASLYTINPHAAVMISLGNAAQTMAAQKPDLGVRLSTYLDQLLARLRQEKLTPPETLQDVLIALDSGYRDPLLGVCCINAASGPDPQAQTGSDAPADAQQAQAAFGQSPAQDVPAQPVFHATGSIAIGEPAPAVPLPAQLTAGTLPRKGGNPVEYIGCASVGNGLVSCTLTAAETRLALTLRRHARITDLTPASATVTVPQAAGLSLEKVAELVTKWQTIHCDGLGVIGFAAAFFATEEELYTFLYTADPASMLLTITFE